MTPSPGIEPGSHWWEANALIMRQPWHCTNPAPQYNHEYFFSGTDEKYIILFSYWYKSHSRTAECVDVSVASSDTVHVTPSQGCRCMMEVRGSVESWNPSLNYQHKKL